MATGQPYTLLIRRLESIVALSEESRHLISQLPTTVRSYKTNQDILREGDVPTQCCLVVDGYLCRHKIANGSKRQIISFHIPGDMPDLHSLHLTRLDHNISTLGPAAVAFIPHASLREMLPRSRELTHAFWRETLVDAAMFREWVVNLGQREALARVSHILCEMTLRLQAIGLARDFTFALPWTQGDLGDACGISPVHVNRVIQNLRAKGTIEWHAKVIKILHWEELKSIGDFSPEYLHLRGEHHDSRIEAH
jgi:CRP-like cAMP-binding protein